MLIGNDMVKTCAVKVAWDGVTKPEKLDDGGLKHSLSGLINPNSPEYAEMQQLADKALAASNFKGVLPPGGHPAFTPADANKLGAIANGLMKFTAVSYNGVPPIYENGQRIDLMQLGGKLYPGCEVTMLLQPRVYDNKSKGVGFWLQGFEIVNPHAPKLDVGSGASESELNSAFGGGATTPQGQGATPAPTATAPQPPAPPAPPAHDLAAGKIMTPAANGVPYEAWIAKNWTDEMLIASGYMVG